MCFSVVFFHVFFSLCLPYLVFGCLLGKEMEEKLPLVIVRLRPCRCECDGVPSMFPPSLCMRLLEFPTNQRWLVVLVTTSPRQMPCHASLQGSG